MSPVLSEIPTVVLHLHTDRLIIVEQKSQPKDSYVDLYTETNDKRDYEFFIG